MVHTVDFGSLEDALKAAEQSTGVRSELSLHFAKEKCSGMLAAQSQEDYEALLRFLSGAKERAAAEEQRLEWQLQIDEASQKRSFCGDTHFAESDAHVHLRRAGELGSTYALNELVNNPVAGGRSAERTAERLAYLKAMRQSLDADDAATYWWTYAERALQFARGDRDLVIDAMVHYEVYRRLTPTRFTPDQSNCELLQSLVQSMPVVDQIRVGELARERFSEILSSKEKARG